MQNCHGEISQKKQMYLLTILCGKSSKHQKGKQMFKKNVKLLILAQQIFVSSTSLSRFTVGKISRDNCDWNKIHPKTKKIVLSVLV